MLKSETWPDANGSPWPGQWNTASVSSGTTVTQENGRGRFTSSAIGGYADFAHASLGDVASDFTLTVDLCLNTDVSEHYPFIYFRDIAGGNDLFVQFDILNDFIYLGRHNSGTPTTLQTVAQAFTANDVAHIKLRAVGSAVTMAVWLNAASEPAPQFSVSESQFISQLRIRLSMLGGAAAASHIVEWDNLNIDEIPVGRPRPTVFRF